MTDRAGMTDFDPRAIRRRWASGVAVVTTVDGEGGYRGATVSAFAAVSLEPPLVLVCLDRSGRMSEMVPDAGIFAVSILESNQEFLAERFAGRAPLPDRHFIGVPYQLAGNGCPLLDGAHAWYACRVAAAHDGGDHIVIIGAVEEAGVGPETDDPLLTYDANYRRLEVR
jgi:flavin reductase (DIM6/NTAB) family NADH-FMN oxidoreductase RutF